MLLIRAPSKRTVFRVLLSMRKIMQGIGTLLIIFAIADFGLSYMGINLTPFFPDGLSRFSPIIFGLIGGALLKADWR